MDASFLFRPIRVGALGLKNRMIMPAMGTAYANADGTVSDRMVRFLSRRAQGGVALVVTELAAVDPSGVAFEREFRVDDDRYLDGLHLLARSVKAAGAAVALQVYHPGRQMSSRFGRRQPVAPSAIPCPLIKEMPRALELGEIHELVEQFARAAARAKAAGFDAVELHGAHGYLLHQFLSPLSNQRTDAYGGDPERRARFPLEVVRRTRELVGRELAILYKLSAEDRLPGGLTLADTLPVARRLAEAGVDALTVSAGTYASFEWVVQPIVQPRGCLRAEASSFKRALDIPVVAVGRINDPALAEEILRNGDADLVALGRALLADPDLPRKVRQGRPDEVRRCIVCNECIRTVFMTQPLRCAVNPETGREAEFPPLPARAPKRVLVVGGGPGGMEAATVACQRGHTVTLLEARGELGGTLRIADRAGYKREVGSLAPSLARRLEEVGVAVKLKTPATVERVRELEPDVVIIATGARSVMPEVPGIDEPYVCTAEECLAGEPAPGGEAVILGAGDTACEVACFLRERGFGVTMLARGTKVARNLEPVTRKAVTRLVQALGIRVLIQVQVEEIRDREVRLRDASGQRMAIPATLVVIAQGVVQDDRLRRALEAEGRAVYALGDCVKPGNVADAMHAAADIALQL